jgi:hypothetical protein
MFFIPINKNKNALMKTILLTSIAAFISATGFAQWNYPTTKKVEVIDTYFGVAHKDNYQWLEDLNNPEVETWFKQQANFSDATMSNISGRDELIAVKDIGAGLPANEVSAMISRAALSIAYGESLSNVLQPFYLLLVFPIMGKGIKI